MCRSVQRRIEVRGLVQSRMDVGWLRVSRMDIQFGEIKGVHMTNRLSIKDIYVGKPDAKDEIGFDGLEGFIKSFVTPDTFNLDGLLNGNYCFITGYKGTGKTALLFYLEYLLKLKAPDACSSFIFFKDEFTETRKGEIDGISKRIMSSVALQKNTNKTK